MDIPLASSSVTSLSQEGVEPEEHIVIAIADYEIPGKGFLPIRDEDVIYILEADASGWWLGLNLAGRKGVLPSTYTLPYAFPPPRPESLRELELLRLASLYGVDLTSGAPVLAQDSGRGAVLLTGGEAPSVGTLEELYKVLDEAILARESARDTLTASLRQLQNERSAAGSSCDPRPSASTRSRGALRAAQRAAADLQASLSCVVRALLAEKAAAVDDAPLEGQGDVSTGTRTSVPSPAPPSHAWYQRVRQFLLANGEAELAECLGSAAELRDVQRAVGVLEQELSTLSQEVRAAEAQYREEKASLQQRIGARDLAVSRMLAWWAEKAEESRSAYLATKAQCLCEAEKGQQEVHSVNYTLEVKRHHFSTLLEELDEARLLAKEVKRKLERRSELNALDEQIQAVNEQIAAALRDANKSQRKRHHSRQRRETPL